MFHSYSSIAKCIDAKLSSPVSTLRKFLGSLSHLHIYEEENSPSCSGLSHPDFSITSEPQRKTHKAHSYRLSFTLAKSFWLESLVSL